MSEFYDNIASTALSLIADRGRPVVVVSPSGTYTPGTGFTEGTDTEQTVYAVFTSYRASEIDGTIIRRDDKVCLIAASGASSEITTKNRIKEGSDTWEIVSIDLVKPGDVAILYKAQVRR